jgi:hypothetical protein
MKKLDEEFYADTILLWHYFGGYIKEGVEHSIIYLCPSIEYDIEHSLKSLLSEPYYPES